ncbi:hypothetical protein BKA64DRAFT_265280 [Cadophora sp. MPI-SDFR-AT-0126]|nr:hypothetical protein BKA64DRAFT_265280 [Leotiomycetes sp. MPI-SDFR-AT-0126]
MPLTPSFIHSFFLSILPIVPSYTLYAAYQTEDKRSTSLSAAHNFLFHRQLNSTQLQLKLTQLVGKVASTNRPTFIADAVTSDPTLSTAPPQYPVSQSLVLRSRIFNFLQLHESSPVSPYRVSSEYT